MFPPNPSSKYCKRENPETSCEDADWKVKVPPGTYSVSITVGDAD